MQRGIMKLVSSFTAVFVLLASVQGAQASLYAELQKDGGYRYSAISSYPLDNSSADLSNMRPAVVRTPVECGGPLFAVFHCRDTEFYNADLHLGEVFKLYALTLGMAPIFSGFVAWGKKDIFDEEAYKEANSEALADLKRRGLALEKIKADYFTFSDHVAGLQNDYDKNYSQSKGLLKQYKDAYESKIQNIEYKINIRNNSGFKADAITPEVIKRRITFKKNDIPAFTADVAYNAAIAASPEQFSTTALSLADKLSVEHARNMEQLKQSTSAYRAQLEKATDTVRVQYNELSTEGTYNLELKAPGQVQFSKNSVLPVEVIVASRSFGTVFPAFTAEDKVVTVSSNGTDLKITNNTNSYVDIKSISLYYNNDVSTSPYELDLPPETYKELKLSQLTNDKIERAATYNDVNGTEAKKESFKYGVAVKYRIVEQNIDKTLYSVPSYNLYKFLSEK